MPDDPPPGLFITAQGRNSLQNVETLPKYRENKYFFPLF
jgi:hypothetical protein